MLFGCELEWENTVANGDENELNVVDKQALNYPFEYVVGMRTKSYIARKSGRSNGL